MVLNALESGLFFITLYYDAAITLPEYYGRAPESESSIKVLSEVLQPRASTQGIRNKTLTTKEIPERLQKLLAQIKADEMPDTDFEDLFPGNELISDDTR